MKALTTERETSALPSLIKQAEEVMVPPMLSNWDLYEIPLLTKCIKFNQMFAYSAFSLFIIFSHC